MIKNNENKNKKQELLAEVWTTYRWITEYLTKTTEEWENKKKKRLEEETARLETWENKTRAQKIETCRRDQQEILLEVESILEEIFTEVRTRTEKVRTTNPVPENQEGSKIPEALPTKQSQHIPTTSMIENLLEELVETVTGKADENNEAGFQRYFQQSSSQYQL